MPRKYHYGLLLSLVGVSRSYIATNVAIAMDMIITWYGMGLFDDNVHSEIMEIDFNI